MGLNIEMSEQLYRCKEIELILASKAKLLTRSLIRG